jgi:hypothetical protein
MCWVYRKIAEGGSFICEVGYYAPNSLWVSVQTFEEEEHARELVHYLNGGEIEK